MSVQRKSFWSGWKELGDFFRQYWSAYGGWRDLWRSPYFHVTIVLTLLSYGIWSQENWWDTVLSINPSILGFTLGGFAILLATATDKFGAILARARLVEEDPLVSPLGKLGGAFVHFIFVQFLSIVYSVIAKAVYNVPPPPQLEFLASKLACRVFWCLGFLISIYALVCAVATTEWVFRAIVWLIKFHKKQFNIEKKNRDKAGG